MTKPSLIADVDAALAEQTTRARERRASERKRQLELVRQSILYTFDQEPDSVRWEDSKIGAVAVLDGIVVSLAYRQSSVPSLSVVCICEQCGQKFLSQESFGADKNHYGPNGETPQPTRRERAVSQIAKVAARNYQPNGYGHDHKCLHYVTREIPFSLLAQVDAILERS